MLQFRTTIIEGPKYLKTRAFLRTPQGVGGLALIAIFWPLNWTLPRTPTAYLFFPLWLGYILVVDGMVLARTATSLLKRSPVEFLIVFVISAPAWWIFEWINKRTQNWEYLGGSKFSGIEYFILSSISFSTVMPAVFESAELIQGLRFLQKWNRGPRLPFSARSRALFVTAGFVMLGMTYLFPRQCYPFVWTSLVLILEAINASLGRPSLLKEVSKGDWRWTLSLAAGGLLCGFFWEMWNWKSYPKWIYHTPGTQFLHIFEMPLLGYLGYIPFAWELYALRSLIWPRPRPSAESRPNRWGMDLQKE
jgi:hypothetical protein